MFSPKIIDSHTEPKEYRLGVLLYKGGRIDRDVDEALTQFKIAWENGHFPSGYNYAIILREKGLTSTADQIFRDIKGNFPDAWYYISLESSDPYYCLTQGSSYGSKLCSVVFGWKLLEDGKLDGARNKFETALTSTDDEIKSKAIEGLGIVKMKENDYVGAMNELIYASEKELTEGQYWLGMCHLQTKNLAAACDEFKKASNKGHRDATIELGKIYLTNGNEEGGIRLLKSFLNDPEKCEFIKKKLSSYYLDQKMFFEALAYVTCKEEKNEILDQAYEYASGLTILQAFPIIKELRGQHKKATYHLGVYYLNGTYCEKNLVEAYDCFRTSQTFEGYMEISKFHEFGKGPCDVDLELALRVLEEEARNLAWTEEEEKSLEEAKQRIERKLNPLPDYEEESGSETYVEVPKPRTSTPKPSSVEMIMNGHEEDPAWKYIAGCIRAAEGNIEEAREFFKEGARAGNRDCLIKLGEMALKDA